MKTPEQNEQEIKELRAHHKHWKEEAQMLAVRVQKQNDAIAALLEATKRLLSAAPHANYAIGYQEARQAAAKATAQGDLALSAYKAANEAREAAWDTAWDAARGTVISSSANAAQAEAQS
jgi:hypothetical protein